MMRTKQIGKAVIQTVKELPARPTLTDMIAAKTEGKAAVAKRARAEANFISKIERTMGQKIKGADMKRESWRFSSVPGFSTDACGTQIGIGDRRTLLDRKRKGNRRDPLGASPQKAGLTLERLGCEGDLDPELRGRMICFIQRDNPFSCVSAQLPVLLGSQTEGATNTAVTHQPVAVSGRQPTSNVCNESISLFYRCLSTVVCHAAPYQAIDERTQTSKLLERLRDGLTRPRINVF